MGQANAEEFLGDLTLTAFGEPADFRNAVDETDGRFIGRGKVGIAFAAEDLEDLENLLPFVMGWVRELGVGEKRVEDPQISMPKSHGLIGEVQEIADNDIKKDPQIVGVEVLVCSLRSEEEIEQFQNEQL